MNMNLKRYYHLHKETTTMRESIFANREPIARYWYTGIAELFQNLGFDGWLMIIFAFICIYILYRVFRTHFIKPGMTAGEKLGALIHYISLLFLINIAIDIVKNFAGYNKKR